MPREKKSKTNGNGANLGFEATLWAAADKMRNNMDAAEYKHVVLVRTPALPFDIPLARRSTPANRPFR